MYDWLNERYNIASEESYRDLSNIQGKVMRHKAFEAELEANKERLDQICEVSTCGLSWTLTSWDAKTRSKHIPIASTQSTPDQNGTNTIPIFSTHITRLEHRFLSQLSGVRDVYTVFRLATCQTRWSINCVDEGNGMPWKGTIAHVSSTSPSSLALTKG